MLHLTQIRLPAAGSRHRSLTTMGSRLDCLEAVSLRREPKPGSRTGRKFSPLPLLLATFILASTVLTAAAPAALAFGLPEGGRVYYNRQLTVYPVMNADTYRDLNFLNSYIEKNNKSIYNVAPEFRRDPRSEGSEEMPYYLTFGTEFYHESDSKTYDVFYTYEIEDPFKPAAVKGDLAVSLIADLHNDRHWNIKRHRETWTAYPTAYISSRNGTLIRHKTDYIDNDKTVSGMGRNEFKSAGSGVASLAFGALGNACTCGSSWVRNISIILADTVGPKVASVWVSRERPYVPGVMQEWKDFKAGDTLYINLKFDEPIRFANDTAPLLEDAPKLRFKVKGIDTDTEEPQIKEEATLVSLDYDTLTFKYVIPETFRVNGQDVLANYYIYEIAPYAQQTTWIGGNSAFELKLFGRTDSSKKYLDTTRRTSSLIVDLAGNPIRTGASVVTVSNPAYLDNVPPTVRRIELVRPEHKYGTVATPRDVFATMGQKIGFYVYFSEEVALLDTVGGRTYTNPWGLVADLNISLDGTPVKAAIVPERSATVRDGLNGPMVSRLYFETTLNSNMAPTIWDGRDLPIGINKIYVDSSNAATEGHIFADICGNQYDRDGVTEFVNAPDGSRIMPAQQAWLDTTKPTATTTADTTEVGGKTVYTPIPFDDGFCFPVTVSDPVGLGTQYQSLTNGMTGVFKWNDRTDGDFMFEYVVTGSVERPTTGWRSGKTDQQCTMLQIDSGNYIHIRLLPDVAYDMGQSEMVIHPLDYAMNAGEVVFPLDLKLDMAGPRFTSNGYRTSYSFTTGGRIDTSVTALDVSKISVVEYQWTAQGEDAAEDGWTAVEDFDGGSTDERKTFILRLDGLPTGAHHQFSLHLRAMDINGYGTGYGSGGGSGDGGSGDDGGSGGGGGSGVGADSDTVVFNMGIDLTTPAYGIDLVTNPSTPQAAHSAKVYLPDQGDIPLEGNAAKLWVLVKNPATGNYWIRVFDYFDVRGEEKAFDIFDPSQDFGAWQTTTPVRKSIAVPDMSVSPPDTLWFDGWSYLPTGSTESGIQDLLTRSYRNVEITIIAKDYFRYDGWLFDSAYDIIDSELVAMDTYVFSMMNGAAISSGTRVHAATISPGSPVAHVGSFYVPSKWMPDSQIDSQGTWDLLNMPTTLDGVIFTVDLRNSLMPSYGIVDIDFESPDTYFSLYRTGSDIPLFMTPLAPQASQYIEIPQGVADETGTYKVVVSICTKSGAHVDRSEYTNISIDARKPDTYGVTRVSDPYNIWTGSGWVSAEEISTTYEIAPGVRTSEIFVSGESSQYIDFGGHIPNVSYGSTSYSGAFIRVWNQTVVDKLDTDPSLYIPESDFMWINWNGSFRLDTWILTALERNEIRDALRNPPATPRMPILPGDNVLKYQIAIPGTGFKTPAHTLLVHAGTDHPVIEMALSPEKAMGPTKDGVVASIKSLSSEVVSPDSLTVGLTFRNGVGLDPALKTTFKEEREVTLTENGEYWFYAYDRYGVFGVEKVTIDWIDKEGPTLTVDNLSDPAKNTFNFRATVSDPSGSDNCRLYVEFDEAYCSVLGVTPGTAFEIPADAQWNAARVSQSGIFSTSRTASGASRVYEVAGAFRFDDSPGVPATGVRTITVYATDVAGNESERKTINVTARNERASYVSGELVGGALTATFSKPVRLSTPSEGTLQPIYSLTKEALPFFTNGQYVLSYSDIFGDLREETITVDQYDALYSCAVSISETAPTNKDVTVALSTAFNEAVVLEPPASVTGATITLTRDGANNVTGATIVMTTNGTFTYTIKPKDTAFPPVTRSIVVNNIDKTPPVVGIMWAYSGDIVTDEVLGEITAGDVIASLDSDEFLVPLEGTGTTHTFSFVDIDGDGKSDEVSYTFKYSDLAGNAGETTVTLPVTIVTKELVEGDVTPPDYEFSVYRMEAGVYTRVERYKRADYEAFYDSAVDKSTAFPLFSGSLQLRFEVTDENQTTIGVSDDPPEGMTVQGKTVWVSANGNYVIVIEDTAGNRTEVPVSIRGADNTPPTGSVEYVKQPGFGIRAYLTVSDDSGQVTVTNTSGVLVETADGPYKGLHYHDFLENGTFTFTFADAVGNKGSAVAAVAILDMSPPTGFVQKWVPYFVDAAGVADEDRLSEKPTNSDVSVYIGFDKYIRTITPSILDGIGTLSDVSVSHTSDSAVVVFRQNAKVRLLYEAVNSKIGSMVLEVGIIDKTAPTITVSPPVSTPGLVTYTFTSDEPVYFEDQDRPEEDRNKPLEPGTLFTKAFGLNGAYSLRFTDLAGNTTVTQVTVAGIDREPPGLTVRGLPATKEEVAVYNATHDPDVSHVLTKEPVSFTVSMNEPGRISFLGISYPVAADQIVTLTVENNGTYELTATDLVGLSTRYQFKVDNIDRQKPQIVLSRPTIMVRQGTSVAEFEDLVLTMAQAIDNCDPSPALAITRSLDDARLGQPGTYEIELAASDSAGNRQSTTAFVRVYSRDMVEVKVNGALALPGETLFVAGNGSSVLSVTVDNLPASPGGPEPYRMYWKQGLNTAGQMKNASEFSGSFTAPKDGFYTVQIVTQGRVTTTLFIYFQK